MNDVIQANRGFGKWQIEIYNPNKILETIEGFLVITKDHYVIFQESSIKTTLLNVPAQNVSYCKKI